jgi:hypothetical protein
LPRSLPFSRSLVLAMSWVAGGTRGYLADQRCAGGRRNFDRARRSCAAYLFYVRPTSTQLIWVYSCAMPRRRQLFVACTRLRLRGWLKNGLTFSSSCQPERKGSDVADVGDEGQGEAAGDCGLEVPCETAANLACRYGPAKPSGARTIARGTEQPRSSPPSTSQPEPSSANACAAIAPRNFAGYLTRSSATSLPISTSTSSWTNTEPTRPS